MPRKKVKVVCAQLDGLDNVREPAFNWEICCLCQKEDDTSLICPAKNPIASKRNQAYKTVAVNLEKLKAFDYKLPCGKSVSCLDEGAGIEACLVVNKAYWHSACVVKFRSPRIDSILNDLHASTESQPSKSTDTEQEREIRPKTRSLTSPPVAMKEFKCFLCQGPETRKHPLRVCATKEITDKVKACATALMDLDLIGMLETGGDLVAMEAKYHKYCLTQLYNRHRKLTTGQGPKQSGILCENIAFAEVVQFIENKLSSDNKFIFDMGNISTEYHSRIASLNKVEKEEITKEHTTRLREKILAYFPMLTAEKWGTRYVLKTRNINLMPYVSKEDQDDDAIAFLRYAKSIRKTISDSKVVVFEGTFSSSCEEDSIPGPLIAAVSTLLYGSCQPSDDYSGARNPANTICQLIMLNYRETLPHGGVVRHSMHREPPLPLYLGLSCYVRNRDKSFIDLLHSKGISVSSNRITEVTSQLCRMVVRRADEEGVVCPSNLKKNIFTVAALDNIDFKSTSSTSAYEFHGTGISVFQCPSTENCGQSRDFFTSYNDVGRKGDRSVPSLPDFYSNVPEFTLTNDKPPVPCIQRDVGDLEMIPSGHISSQWEKEKRWLCTVNETLSDTAESLNNNCNGSWSSFHAAEELQKSNGTKIASISALLPLFHEKSSSPSMIKHGMDIVRDLTKFLNVDQVPVVCMDQQLYTIAKIIQWCFPDEYGEGRFVVMLGPLHIEQSFLRVLGQFLEGSGWTTILAHSGICSSGSAEALLKVTHIKRAREIHQVTAAVLFSLAMDEYQKRNTEGEISFEDWLKERAAESPTFKYWLTLLNLEIALLSFIRAVRLGDYLEFRESLKQLAPWYFVFDHQNYARWLPVFILDLEQLENNAPGVHSEFMQGRFVVHKTRNLFNGLGIDHAHEQNNAIVKGRGGAVGLTNDPCSLRRWTIGGPEVSRLLHDVKSLDETEAIGMHHEQKLSYQLRFLEFTIALKNAFLEYDNPFSIRGPELLSLDTRSALSDETVVILENLEQKGSLMYKNFVTERLVEKTKSIYDPIKKCQTQIFAAKKKAAKTTALSSLKSDVNLFSRSFIVSVTRNMDLDQFFAHENQDFPPSLSLNGEVRTGDKMQLTLILEKLITSADKEIRIPSNFDGVVIDGAVMVHSVRPRPDIKTFNEYAAQVEAYLRSTFIQRFGMKRLDIAWDLYLPRSLKQATRSGRGAGVRRVELPTKGKLPTDWADYLRNDLNKEELFRFLSQALAQKFQDIHFVTNVDSTIVSSGNGFSDLDGVSCLNMEEADGRILLHLQDAVVGSKAQNMVVRSCDTDVLVILLSFFPDLCRKGLKQLWLQFGVGSKRRYISVHEIAAALGDDKALALRGFHAFSGCDFTSFFNGKGKRSAWAAWDSSFVDAFKHISEPQADLDPAVFDELEKFTVRLYGVHSEAEARPLGVNEARKIMFASESKHLSSLPPTKAALKEHIKRSAYVAGHVWGRANLLDGNSTSPEGWGWTETAHEWRVVWSSLPQVWKAVRTLDRCGCASKCETLRCICRRDGLPCSAACRKCMGQCANTSTCHTGEEEDDVLGDP